MSKWDYINGAENWDNTVQISPDGKTLLVKETKLEYHRDGLVKERSVSFYITNSETMATSKLEPNEVMAL